MQKATELARLACLALDKGRVRVMLTTVTSSVGSSIHGIENRDNSAWLPKKCVHWVGNDGKYPMTIVAVERKKNGRLQKARIVLKQRLSSIIKVVN